MDAVTLGMAKTAARLERVRSAGAEGGDLFSAHPDGAIVRTHAGLPYSVYPESGARMPVIEDGRMTFGDAAAGGGGYLSLPSDEPIISARAAVSFTPYTTPGGLACLALMETDLPTLKKAGGTVPRSPAHLNLYPEGWDFGTFPTEGLTSPDPLASTVYGTPLATGDQAVHLYGVTIEKETNTAWLDVPDGLGGNRIVKATRADIGSIDAWTSFVEPYRPSATAEVAATMTRPRFLWWEFESNTWRYSFDARSMRYVRSRVPSAGRVIGGSARTISASVSLNTIDDSGQTLRVQGFYGPSGGVHVIVSAYCQVAAGTSYYWGLHSLIHNAGINESTMKVSEAVTDSQRGAITAVLTVTTGSAYGRFDVALKHLINSGGAAAIWLGPNYPVTLTAIPF